jgi:hypothetical protein
MSAHQGHRFDKESEMSDTHYTMSGSSPPARAEKLNSLAWHFTAERHPDRGGSAEAMSDLSAARDWGIDFIEHPPLINLNGGAK